MRIARLVADRVRLLRRDERGQVAFLFALALLFFFMIFALAVDSGLWYFDQRTAQSQIDAAAAAAAQELPFALDDPQGNNVRDAVWDWLERNGADQSQLVVCPGAPTSGLSGDPDIRLDDRLDENGAPGTDGELDTLVICLRRESPSLFANFFSITGVNVSAKAVATGALPPRPVDVIMVLDRTPSMGNGPGGSDSIPALQAGARAVLEIFEPSLISVGIGVIGPNDPNESCSGSLSSGRGQAADTQGEFDAGEWVLPFGLLSDYKDGNGSANLNSALYETVDCIEVSPAGAATNLALPMAAARSYLINNGRPNAKLIIIFMTDGEPRFGAWGVQADFTCQAASDAAQATKAAGITVYTLGYGVSGLECPSRTQTNPCNANTVNPFESSAWSCDQVTALLSSMATSPSHFYLAPGFDDLEPAFRDIATAILGSVSLVE